MTVSFYVPTPEDYQLLNNFCHQTVQTNRELTKERDELKTQVKGLLKNALNYMPCYNKEEELSRLKRELSETQVDIEGLTDANEDFIIENSDLKAQIIDLRVHLKGIQDENEDLIKEVADLKSVNENLCTRINNLVQERSDLQKERDHYRNNRDALSAGNEHLKSQWKGQCTLVDSLKEQIQGLNAENLKLRERNGFLERNSIYEKTISTDDIIKHELFSRDAEIKLLKAKANQLIQSRDQLRKNNQSLTNEIKALKIELREALHDAAFSYWARQQNFDRRSQS